MSNRIRICLATLSILALAGAAAEAAQRVERITLAAGLTTATINGRIKGDDGVSYVVGATQGQKMSVSFTPENPSCHFNVLPPGSEQALHDGTNGGNVFSGTLPVSGDYATHVYLVQDAAQRDEVCDYSIKIEVTG
jgi:hypothetical protein